MWSLALKRLQPEVITEPLLLIGSRLRYEPKDFQSSRRGGKNTTYHHDHDTVHIDTAAGHQRIVIAVQIHNTVTLIWLDPPIYLFTFCQRKMDECSQVCLCVCVCVCVCARSYACCMPNRTPHQRKVREGGCSRYGNSQAGLSLISLPLCLLELWEETREEGCPETATAFKKTVTTSSDKSLYSNQIQEWHIGGRDKGAHSTITTVDRIQ